MCEKIKQGKFKLRTELRKMEQGQEMSFIYSPKEMSLSSIRVTASSTGIDLGRRYKVTKKDKEIVIERIQ